MSRNWLKLIKSNFIRESSCLRHVKYFSATIWTRQSRFSSSRYTLLRERRNAIDRKCQKGFYVKHYRESSFGSYWSLPFLSLSFLYIDLSDYRYLHQICPTMNWLEFDNFEITLITRNSSSYFQRKDMSTWSWILFTLNWILIVKVCCKILSSSSHNVACTSSQKRTYSNVANCIATVQILLQIVVSLRFELKVHFSVLQVKRSRIDVQWEVQK